jgi:hypothetical protein
MQLEQHARRLRRLRLAAYILARQIAETEFAAAAALPQKIAVELACEGLRLCEQLGARGSLEAHQHVRGLDFRAFAVRALHLHRGRRLRKHRANLQLAVFLVKNLHVARAGNA